ncbi:quinol monooxygenase YgiN [Alteromonadaceae bacterium 2753L.S.0a.02]|nr:quinol monooxygenase YgiN [Alteromonadaceae bacterium 2753L.S.0a.02]
MSKIKLSGYIDIPVEDLQAVLRELPMHISLSRDEPGCLEFNVVQDSEIATRLYVYEIFASEPHFEHHQRRLQTSDWGQLTASATRNYKKEVIRYDSTVHNRNTI